MEAIGKNAITGNKRYPPYIYPLQQNLAPIQIPMWSRRTIFIDIEALPALNLSASGSPPVRPASTDENHLKTALNGDFGCLLCIKFIGESSRGEIERGVIG